MKRLYFDDRIGALIFFSIAITLLGVSFGEITLQDSQFIRASLFLILALYILISKRGMVYSYKTTNKKKEE